MSDMMHILMATNVGWCPITSSIVLSLELLCHTENNTVFEPRHYTENNVGSKSSSYPNVKDLLVIKMLHSSCESESFSIFW